MGNEAARLLGKIQKLYWCAHIWFIEAISGLHNNRLILNEKEGVLVR